MTKNQKIFASIDALVEMEGLERNLVIEGLQEAVAIACKKYYSVENVAVEFNDETKRIKIVGTKIVKDPDEIESIGEPWDEMLYLTMEEAMEYKKTPALEEEIVVVRKSKVEPDLMDRSTIQTAKQVFRQKLREAKYKKIVLDYGDKVGEIVFGTLEEHRDAFTYLRLSGSIDCVLGPKGQIPGETFEPDVPIMLYIEAIAPLSKKGPKIIVSRTNPKIVETTMRDNVPEIEQGLIEIKAIARDAGKRSKVALEKTDIETDIDVIGSCVGPKGSRINQVRKLINGENIDLIEYFDDPSIFISNALAPALVTAVQIIDEENKQSRVIVDDDQLSLAIGIGGQNVRLSSILTGWKIDIKSVSEADELGIDYSNDVI